MTAIAERSPQPRAPLCWLARLDLTAFRNHAATRIETRGEPVVLVGPNGAGKTNLLEAISFLSPGRGLRSASVREPDRAGQNLPWAVSAWVEGGRGLSQIGTGRDPNRGEEGERRIVRIDGETQRGQQSLSDLLSVIWLTPQMDGLFRDGGAGRRRFLDRLVFAFDPAHAGRVSAYERALRERGRLLKAGDADPRWLDGLEDTMARYGVAVAAARGALIASLNDSAAVMRGPFPQPEFALSGDIDRWISDLPALDVEDRIRASLCEGRARDADYGGAASGPHRSDLEVSERERGLAAAEGSTGEQKALLVATLIAHAQMLKSAGLAPPVLLLDEIAAHLDPARRAALFQVILSGGLQAWMTGTEREAFEGLEGSALYFEVNEGSVATCA